MDTTLLSERLRAMLGFPLLKLGEVEITLWPLVYFLILLLLLFYFTGKLKKLLIERVLVRASMDIGARQAVGSITRYLLIFIGLLIDYAVDRHDFGLHQ